jgi:hypothetical protein
MGFLRSFRNTSFPLTIMGAVIDCHLSPEVFGKQLQNCPLTNIWSVKIVGQLG